MTTATPVRIESIPSIEDTPEALEQLRYGLLNADAYIDLHRANFWDHDGGELPALKEWDRLKEEATDEILPDVARMLTEAIRRRLPWTWEADR